MFVNQVRAAVGVLGCKQVGDQKRWMRNVGVGPGMMGAFRAGGASKSKTATPMEIGEMGSPSMDDDGRRLIPRVSLKGLHFLAVGSRSCRGVLGDLLRGGSGAPRL